MRGYEVQTGEIGISLPDGVTMAVAIDPSIATSASHHFVDIECHSELTRGMTVVDKLNLADDVRNVDTWREALKNPNKPLICWELDAARWKTNALRIAALDELRRRFFYNSILTNT